MSERPRRLWMMSCALVVALLPVLYAGGYFLLGPDDPLTPGSIDRQFSRRWLAFAYIPLGLVEANVRGTVISFHISGAHLSDPYANFMIVFEP